MHTTIYSVYNSFNNKSIRYVTLPPRAAPKKTSAKE